jgi:hypothetical protein
MFRVLFIGGAVFWGICYGVSKYARNRVEQKQNPLTPFAS